MRAEQHNVLGTRLGIIEKQLAEQKRRIANLINSLEIVDDDETSADIRERIVERTKTKNDLEREQKDLAVSLAEKTLSNEQIETIQSVCARLALLVDKPLSVELMREVFELLDVRVRLAVEEGEYIAYARCILVAHKDEDERAIVKGTSCHTSIFQPTHHRLRQLRGLHPPAA